MKTDKSKTEELPYISKLKSYSVDEILAAGGPEAFSKKMGKSAKGFFEALYNLPQESRLTEEEVKEAIDILNATK